jgi:uroporphyrinogen decarboxylase
MTSRERIQRTFAHQEADRVPVWDKPAPLTLKRWEREGLSPGSQYTQFFGLDRIEYIIVDNSPRYPRQVLERTDEYVIRTTEWGATLKEWRHRESTPEFRDFIINDPDQWQAAKKRITTSGNRINWAELKRNYKRWRSEGAWIRAQLWFGFDVTHSWMVGTERTLLALIENPGWCRDMFGHLLEVNLRLLDRIWEAGYHFDSIWWPDDMGYTHKQFFSPAMYRELLKPYHKRAIEWAHQKGIKAQLHSCGDINPLIPDLIELGLDALHPLEVKAGMDPLRLKQQYGQQLVLDGGINAALWENPEALKAEITRLLPVLKENGGYIFGWDDAVPSSVPLQTFKEVIAQILELGAYE